MYISLIIILSVLILLILLLLFSRVYIRLQYTLNNKHQQLLLRMTILKIRFYKKNIDISGMPVDVETVDFKTFPDEMKHFIKNVKDSKEKIDHILKQVTIHRFYWSTTGGTGDAFLNGIASGAIWALKGMMTGYIAENGNLACRPRIEVLPTFQTAEFMTSIDCIISLRLGQAIHTLLRFLKSDLQ
ncbi:hypothetical protein CWR48_17090 [Oceanobacillus arenosus]|uniref:DUF2953 domain-containing protein n=1 Tax=Oceanobacillus arenosus TaxID=1229153 RepID=A0A3D8PM91_9BACI|nr:DUF2953 domain-containing protein [Oceanobacillus arenosus]RDW16359.1 hypothetical protein CWR48_17090 [Oceanobacillus arenosus]